MMLKENKMLTKVILTIIAISLVFFGALGFFISAAGAASNVKIKKYYAQHPLNDKNGIAVDSKENIYIGEAQTGSIQVYDKLGNFKYGFCFPTGGGWFAFGIEKDKIHIVTARTDSYFIFDKGKVIFSKGGIDYDYSEELQTRYNMTTDNEFDMGNKIYKISSFNTVSVRDNFSGQVKRIHLNVPIWPFSIAVFWLIAACGMGIIFLLNHKWFFLYTKRARRG